MVSVWGSLVLSTISLAPRHQGGAKDENRPEHRETAVKDAF